MRITSYTYDNYNRLSNATANAFSRNYQYDEWGNVKNFSGLTLNYATNGSGAPSTNRLLSDSQGGSYTYDAAGNQTAGAGQSYSYDGANRLKEVGTTGANVYGYDGDGKRVKKTEGGATTYYIYSSKLGQSVMEVSANSVQRAFVYNGGKLVAMQATDGQFYWLHTNHLGNSRAMTDGSGNLTYKGQFDPYGASLTEWSSSGNTNLNNKKFTGYERDTSGLDYANARMYNSARGRFQIPDPIGLKAANMRRPQTLNRYSYVHGDPVNFVDVSGTYACPVAICKPPLPPPESHDNGDADEETREENEDPSDGGGSQDTYNALTADEKMLCFGFPEACMLVNGARNGALQERLRRYGATGANDDWCDNAFLHAYWNALMVRSLSNLPSEFLAGGTGVEMAKAFADAHEARPNNPEEERRMDFWNNSVGRIIATQNPNATAAQLADLIAREVNEGRVLVMDGNGQTPRHPRPGECNPNP